MKKGMIKTLGAAMIVSGAMGLVAGVANAAGKSGAEMIRKLDTDGDQRVSKAEFEAGYSEKFDMADTNRDGVMSTEELAAKKNKKDGTNKGLKAEEKMAKKDMNADGQLSAEEFAQAKTAKFEKMDANKDGFLTAQEIDSGKRHK